MRAVLAVAACAAAVATAGAVNHIRAANASARCPAAAVTQSSNQDPAAVAAYWSQDHIQQAQQNMRRATSALPAANRGCHTGP